MRIEPAQDVGYSHSPEPPWFAVGRFDGERVYNEPCPCGSGKKYKKCCSK
ncbi:MAG: SEC-C metal-binding domain-containing protein [Polyangia bacterium]